jgi:hypothetical protein
MVGQPPAAFNRQSTLYGYDEAAVGRLVTIPPKTASEHDLNDKDKAPSTPMWSSRSGDVQPRRNVTLLPRKISSNNNDLSRTLL